MKSHSKTYYNDIALKLIQKLWGLKYLHYGFFDESIPLTIDGLKIAQQKYTEKILKSFPAGIKKIADVGCGAGGNAVAFVSSGLDVTCVDPDPYLLSKTREATKNQVKTFAGLYENVDLSSAGPFDLLLMSESCQYISPEHGWLKHSQNVKAGGYVMAVDFFITKEIDHPYLSKSGHRIDSFIEVAKKNGFELIVKEDITRQTAPTMDIYQDLISNKIFPVIEAVFEFVERRFNWFYRLIRFFAGEKIKFLKTKYSNQDSKTFAEYKTYYLLLFQKKN